MEEQEFNRLFVFGRVLSRFMKTKEQEGMAIIGVLMVVLIFTSLCTCILFLADQETLIADYQEETLKAFYAAEAGIQTIISHIKGNPQITWQEIETMCTGISSRTPPVGTASIESIVPEDLGDSVKFTVTGVSQSATKVLEAYVTKPCPSPIKPLILGLTCEETEGGILVSSNQRIEGDMFVSGSLTILSQGCVVGNIYALGNVTVEAEGEVQGSIVSHGLVTVAENAIVTGQVSELQATVPQVPEFGDLELETGFFREEASQAAGHYFPAQQCPKTLLAQDVQEMQGIYFAEGDIIFDAQAVSYTGNAVVVAKGNMYVEGSLEPADNDSTLALLSYGNIVLQDTEALEGVLIAGGSLDSNGNKGTITGIVAAENMANCTHDFYFSPGTLIELEDYLYLQGIPARLDIWREHYDIY